MATTKVFERLDFLKYFLATSFRTEADSMTSKQTRLAARSAVKAVEDLATIVAESSAAGNSGYISLSMAAGLSKY